MPTKTVTKAKPKAKPEKDNWSVLNDKFIELEHKYNKLLDASLKPSGHRIIKKLHGIQMEVQNMTKDGRNEFSKYNYLSETQVTIKMKELFDKYGVLFTYSTIFEEMVTIGKQTGPRIKLIYTFWDMESDSSIKGELIGIGIDTGDKGLYKAITGAIKYLYMKTFNIPTGDDAERTDFAKKEKPAPTTTSITKLKEELHKLGAKDEQSALTMLKLATEIEWKDFNVTEKDASLALAKFLMAKKK